jgi:DNA-binding transcriptional MerR regulator
MRDMAHSDDELLTIDALARRSGLTTRNIRAYQSRGLLPAPEVRGRTGYYGPEHLERLELIREMQADGFNLTAIKRLLDGSRGAWEEALGLKRAAVAAFETETPELTTAAELARRFGNPGPKVVDRAVELGLIVPLGDDRFELPSPELIRAGEEVVALGVRHETALDVLEVVLRESDAVAGAFVRLFLDHVVKPFYDEGMPEEEWPRVRDALERLRPVAFQTVSAAFAQRMTPATEEAFGRVLGGDEWPNGSGPAA